MRRVLVVERVNRGEKKLREIRELRMELRTDVIKLDPVSLSRGETTTTRAARACVRLVTQSTTENVSRLRAYFTSGAFTRTAADKHACTVRLAPWRARRSSPRPSNTAIHLTRPRIPVRYCLHRADHHFRYFFTLVVFLFSNTTHVVIIKKN